MNAPGHGTRRKACDFCVSRKIRCDVFSPNPVCSNCALYGAACKITTAPDTARKKAALRYAKSAAATTASSSSTSSVATSPVSSVQPDRIDALQVRLANIESYLAQLATTAQQSAQVQLPGISDANRPGGEATIPACQSPPAQHLELPPLPDVLPLVDNYFRNFNRFLPILDESAFTRILLDLYSAPSNRSIVSWAAVNAVIAVCYRILEGLPAEDPRVSSCFRNLQSAMADLMTSHEDLLSIQTLLAMIIVFQGSMEPQLSIVLMGSTMRQVQLMKLHRKKSLQGHTSGAALHRRRVFWIAYFLDRDLSLRSQCPYFQLDGETDQEMPEKEPEDGLGIICSTENDRFNYLRARVQLAFIQGKAYDILNSKRGQDLTQEQKLSQVARIDSLLHDWQKNIPDSFQQADTLQQSLSRSPTQLLTTLYFRHLECLCRIKAIFLFDITWIRRVVCYLSPAVIELRDGEADGEVVRSNLEPLPAAWADCVNYCRRCLDLTYSEAQSDYAYWLHGCGIITCIFVLVVNMIEFPEDMRVPIDRAVVEAWQNKSLQMRIERSSELVEMFNMFQQLDRRARGQINRTTCKNATDVSGLLSENFLDNFGWDATAGMGR